MLLIRLQQEPLRLALHSADDLLHPGLASTPSQPRPSPSGPPRPPPHHPSPLSGGPTSKAATMKGFLHVCCGLARRRRWLEPSPAAGWSPRLPLPGAAALSDWLLSPSHLLLSSAAAARAGARWRMRPAGAAAGATRSRSRTVTPSSVGNSSWRTYRADVCGTPRLAGATAGATSSRSRTATPSSAGASSVMPTTIAARSAPSTPRPSTVLPQLRGTNQPSKEYDIIAAVSGFRVAD